MPAESSPDPLWTAVGLTTPWPESTAPARADRAAPGRPKPHPLPRAAASRSGAAAADRAEPRSEA
jgi:hypothetical protein